ncbi:MAG: LysE family translocator, partial [Spirochaetota bacterium]
AYGMEHSSTHIASALFIGIFAGITTGPLSVYILSEVAAGRPGHGIAAAFSPLVSDGPVAILSIVVLSAVPDRSGLFSLLFAAGGIYLLFLSYRSFADLRHETAAVSGTAGHSLIRGVWVNLLNPNPYIFWITVGGPVVGLYAERFPVSAFLFVIFFYSGLVGTKCALAFAGIWGTRKGVAGTILIIRRILGVLLALYALYFFWQSVALSGIR